MEAISLSSGTLLYSLMLFIASLLSLGMAFYAWRQHTTLLGRLFAWFMIAVGEWSLGYAFEIISSDFSLKVLWAKIEYLGIVSLPVLWLLFAVVYSRHIEGPFPRQFWAFFLIPLITVALVFTNERHHLIWQHIEFVYERGFAIFLATYGSWFWIHTFYSYLCIFAGIGICLADFVRESGLARWRTGLIIAGILLPVIANVLYIFRISGILDLSPFFTVAGGILWAYALARFKLLDLLPIAYRRVIEGMGDGVVVLDNSYRVVDINPAAQEFLNITLVEVVGKPASEVFPSWQKVAPLLQTSNPPPVELAIGEPQARRFYEIALSALTHPRGERAGYLLLLRDITERKKAELELIRRTQELAALYSIVSAIGQFLDLNRVLQAALEATMKASRAQKGIIFLVEGEKLSLATQFGMSKECLARCAGFRLGEHIPGKVALTGEPVLIKDALIESTTSDEVLLMENPRSIICLPVKVKEQVVAVMAHLHSQPHHFTEDDVRLLMAACGQIAVAIENARLYHDISKALIHLRAVIDSSYEGIILISPDLHIQEINRPALRILDLEGTPDDWVGKHVAQVFMSLRHKAPGAVRKAIKGLRCIRARPGSPVKGELKIEGPPFRIVRYINVPVQLDSQLLGWLITLLDVTQEHLLNRMREDLTDMLVHDMRNPISLISMALEIVTGDAVLSQDQKEALQIARRSLERMTRLLDDILDVSRLESGRMPMSIGPVNIPEVIAEVLHFFEPRAASHQLRLINMVPPDLPPAQADRDLAVRVLENIIGNAIKFTPAGGEIRVGAGVEGNEVHIWVSDTGPGIPPELQSRIFEKFVIGKHKRSGSGLGLAFCKLAVEAQGGRIWVESEPGKYTTFTFTLPLYTESDTAPESGEPPDPSERL